MKIDQKENLCNTRIIDFMVKQRFPKYPKGISKSNKQTIRRLEKQYKKLQLHGLSKSQLTRNPDENWKKYRNKLKEINRRIVRLRK